MKSTIELRKTQPKRSGNGSSVQVIIDNVLYYFTKTGNYNISIKTINKNHCKSHYFDNNGNEITKSEYEMVNPPKKSYETNVFYINLLELIEVK